MATTRAGAGQRYRGADRGVNLGVDRDLALVQRSTTDGMSAAFGWPGFEPALAQLVERGLIQDRVCADAPDGENK